MISTASKLYVRHRSIVFVCHSAAERFNWQVTFYSLLPTMRIRTVCLRVEHKNADKQSHMAQRIAYHQRIQKLS